MFQTIFPSIIRSSKLHIQRQVLVWQMPDAVRAVLSSWWWTENPSEPCTASYRNKLWNVKSCWLYCANSWNPQGPTRPVQELLYLCFTCDCIHPLSVQSQGTCLNGTVGLYAHRASWMLNLTSRAERLAYHSRKSCLVLSYNIQSSFFPP